MTNKKRLRDILAEHADKLVKLKAELESTPTETELEAELSSLFDVAERVQSTLRPITPSPDFENELKRELLTTAHLRKAEGYVPPNPTRDLQIIAAIVGLLATLVAIHIMWRLR